MDEVEAFLGVSGPTMDPHQESAPRQVPVYLRVGDLDECEVATLDVADSAEVKQELADALRAVADELDAGEART